MTVGNGQRQVLMIDDEASSRKLVTLLLQREGYRVLTAANGEEGMVLAKAEHPSVILLDVMMPKVDGYETLRRLKQDPDTRTIPVMMLTAKGADHDISTSFELGAAFHLDKPYQIEDLLRKIEAAVVLGEEAARDRQGRDAGEA